MRDMPIRVTNPLTGESAWRDELRCGAICHKGAYYGIIFHTGRDRGVVERRDVLCCKEHISILIDASNKQIEPGLSWTVVPVTVTSYPCGHGCDHQGYVNTCPEHGGPL